MTLKQVINQQKQSHNWLFNLNQKTTFIYFPELSLLLEKQEIHTKNPFFKKIALSLVYP